LGPTFIFEKLKNIKNVMNHNQCGQLMDSWRDEEFEMRDEKWEMWSRVNTVFTLLLMLIYK
jgi:hypothetical protein